MNLTLMAMNICIILQSVFLTLGVHAITPEPISEKFFSLVEIKGIEKKPLQTLEYVKATDDVALAYRAYLPLKPRLC